MEAHRAACHYADEALKADVEIAHIDDVPARRGTATAALTSLADLSPLATGIGTTEGLSTEDPLAIDTPSSRSEDQQRQT